MTGIGIGRRVLLACGILSSLLYAVTDLLGGMRYEGYSFASQAVSELGAVGATSKAFVDPLFFTYGLLAIAFGVGVFREAAERRSRAMRISAALLIGYAAFGLTGSLFPMGMRGTGSLATDLPHIVLTGILVTLLLGAMVFGAFAFGRRFRVYSFTTVFAVIMFGALTVPYAARLASGLPTPGFGIVERINIYAFMLWVAALGVALLRRPAYGRGKESSRSLGQHREAGGSAPWKGRSIHQMLTENPHRGAQ